MRSLVLRWRRTTLRVIETEAETEAETDTDTEAETGTALRATETENATRACYIAAMRERPIRGLCGARCIRCRTHLDACVCDVIAALPPLRSPSRVHLLLHLSEGRKNTNTGWLATTLLGGAVHPVGRDLPEPTLPDDALLLTPDASRALRPDDAGRPLLVLDAAWRPARRLRRKLRTLHTRDTVALPASLVHERGYGLRHDARESHLATAEAIALALGILGAPETERALLTLFSAFVERGLRVRGVVPTPRATVPA